MTKTERKLWRDAIDYRSTNAQLYKIHGEELVVFSKRDYDRMLKTLKGHPLALKAFQKLDITMSVMDITPPWKQEERLRHSLKKRKDLK